MKVGVTMESCSICQGKIPLSERGTLMLSGKTEQQAESIRKALRKWHPVLHPKQHRVDVSYSSWEALQSIMEKTLGELPEDDTVSVTGSLITEEGSRHMPGNEFSLYELNEQITHPELVKIIQDRLFQSFMQPVVDTRTGEPIGYEFLLRPNSKLHPFNPGELFAFSQGSGLQSMLDSQARINAIRTSSHKLMPGMKRFINFLPSSIYDPSHCLKSTFKAARDYKVKPEDLVFEVVETEQIEDMQHLQFIFEEYKKAGVKVALDDVGTGYSTVDVLKQLKPNYAKIDRSLIQDIDQHPEKLDQIKLLRKVADDNGIILLAEGIETAEEYKVLQQYVHLAQGYYFGKPLSRPA
ncbi:EAL domain-containing protein [Alkalicoccus chagannorensis]|uniref:EAL domain-containing protein n=1 Tax=Alkalicoccus chagannorensis TaxID=427072 RepID=UPI0006844AD4|nr:EAL domain-containing protein [Alkalicoccus chagannorensis]